MKLKRALKFGVVPFCTTALLACTIGGKKKINVTVTFNTNGGSTIQPLTIEKGKTITKPADPTKDEASFSHWYLNTTDEKYEFDFDTPINNDLTLNAKWVNQGVKTVRVTFKNYNGSIVEPAKRIEKGTDACYECENIPVKPIEGNEELNIFTKWDKNLENINEDTTFTALYTTIKKGEYKDSDNDGIPDEIDTEKDNNNFKYGAKSMVYLDDLDINIDFSKFINLDSMPTYDKEIAKLGLLMSNPKVDFKDGLFTDKECGSRNNALYSRLAFDDFKHFDFKNNDYQYDPNDTTSGVYGHKNLYDANGKIVRDLIVIAFEGTNGKKRWSSNFDIGYDGDVYFDKTGGENNHPEWDKDHRDYHKGFYVAAKRVLANKVDGPNNKEGPVKFIDYIKNHSSHSNGNPVVFVTGHSRGGAMANLVGYYLEKEMKDQCTPLTYAFAAPSVWGGGIDAPNCNTIFHVLNKDDIVTQVPYTGWGFGKIQTNTISVSINDDDSGRYKAAYEKNLQKKTYGYIKAFDSMLANLKCNNREEIYTFDKVGEGLVPKYLSEEIETFDLSEKDKAETRLKEMIEFNKQNLGEFANFVELHLLKNKDEYEEEYYAIQANCCVGTITSIAQNVMMENEQFVANFGTWLPYVKNEFFIDLIAQLGREIITNIFLGLCVGDAIALPHDYASYQIILNN